eukprot:8709129-Karenia_brevis.AAC.1
MGMPVSHTATAENKTMGPLYDNHSRFNDVARCVYHLVTSWECFVLVFKLSRFVVLVTTIWYTVTFVHNIFALATYAAGQATVSLTQSAITIYGAK